MRLSFCLVVLSLPAQPAFRPAPCAFSPPQSVKVECGWLTVPECRGTPRSRQLEIHVARYRSAAARPRPDPIVWLVGGPGGAGHTLSVGLFDQVVRPYLAARDFIVLDPRGTGHSSPSLACQTQDDEFAADLEDLRKALRIRQWNVVGESYGTHLALVAMRRFPRGIRSAVLDSVAPPGFDNRADSRRWTREALERLELNCARDPACHAAGKQSHRVDGVKYGTAYDFTLNRHSLPTLLFLMLYDAQEAGRIPAALAALPRGNLHPAWHRAATLHAVIEKHLANATVNVLWSCNDSGRLPGFRQQCEASGLEQQIRPGDSISAIPALVLNGEYDPSTPPEAAREAAKFLSRSQLFILPGYGHMVTSAGPCPAELINGFLLAPDRPLTRTCAGTLRTAWELPARSR
jgi:pimeloyl-ACP methyl ester carboxylesterase